jgi:DNA polymerase-3 subunit beta
MHFTIARELLKIQLDKAANTVSAKESQPMLKNFLMKVEGSRLRITATDQNLGAIADLSLVNPTTNETTSRADGAVAVPAEKLLSITNSAPEGEMMLKAEGLILTVLGNYKEKDSTGKVLPEPVFTSKWVLHCMDPSQFPDLPDWDQTAAIDVVREDLLAGLDQVSFAAAKNELKQNLMVVNFNNGYMYAADGHRACRREFKTEKPLSDFSIPSGAVKLLVNILKAASVPSLQFCKTKSYLLFKVGEDLFSALRRNAEFPDVEKAILSGTDKYAYSLSVNRKQLTDVITRASVTSWEDHKLIFALTTELEQHKLTFRTKNTVEDSFEEIIEGQAVTWNGQPFERQLNWEYLLDVLSVLTSDNVVIRMGEDKPRPTMFRVEEGTFVCVVLPLRQHKDNLGRDEKVHKRVAGHVDAERTKEIFNTPPATP